MGQNAGSGEPVFVREPVEESNLPSGGSPLTNVGSLQINDVRVELPATAGDEKNRSGGCGFLSKMTQAENGAKAHRKETRHKLYTNHTQSTGEEQSDRFLKRREIHLNPHTPFPPSIDYCIVYCNVFYFFPLSLSTTTHFPLLTNSTPLVRG
ncbi:uncharacterized protein LOC129793940 [Lutzomyia longipalpis]|uniref:uncharacterized protein LOC129793940 n=1 Tax=Lutzomyia longipalpis TaxID=7200 RepID=UPI0024837404|nr:uncharacterized protein LOC129793940 [Lutzomyia longipalpis]